jgi:hypothetical protein
MFMEILDQIGDPMSSSSAPRFTEKQGQYLAFIATYTLLNRRPPAEADFQRFFEVTPPAVHQMIVTLERRGLVSRVPGQSRTITVMLPDDELPRLQPIKTTATRYYAGGVVIAVRKARRDHGMLASGRCPTSLRSR